jgi:hypothetical protein
LLLTGRPTTDQPRRSGCTWPLTGHPAAEARCVRRLAISWRHMDALKARLLRPARGIRCVKIERRRLGAQSVSGVPLALSPNLVLLREVVDHAMNGFVVIRTPDITHIRSDQYERFGERILRGENALGLVRGPRAHPPIRSWESLFRGLQKRRNVITVEAERRSELYVGRVLGVTARSLVFHFMDATGIWDMEPLTISFRTITRVVFDSHYDHMLQKYGAPRPNIAGPAA